MVFAGRAQDSPEHSAGSDKMGRHPKWPPVNGSGRSKGQLGDLEEVREGSQVWCTCISKMPAGKDAHGRAGYGELLGHRSGQMEETNPPTDASVIYKAPQMSSRKTQLTRKMVSLD